MTILSDDLVEKAKDAMRADPFIDDIWLEGTTQQDMRIEHYARACLLAALPDVVEAVAQAVVAYDGSQPHDVGSEEYADHIRALSPQEKE